MTDEELKKEFEKIRSEMDFDWKLTWALIVGIAVIFLLCLKK